MQLTTPRLTLRSFRSEDLESFSEMHGDEEVMKFLGGTLSHDESEKELLDIMDTEANTGLIRFAIERIGSSGLVGYCGLKPAEEFVDLSYMIARRYWRQGFALEAAKRVRKYGLEDLSITNMEAGGAAENIGSIKILEQLSFRNCENLVFNNRQAIRFYD